MKLTSVEDYGLRCLLRVGRAGEGGSLTIAELARVEGISESNVAKMMRILRQGGLVKSTRGQAGGYSLARPAGEIQIGHALAVLGGRLYEPAFCEGHSGIEVACTHMPDCSIRSVWRMVQQAVDQVLGTITLKDLLRSEPEMNEWRPAPGRRLPTYAPDA
jgi:Rrf2 family iron-sulfur cluster assembly transcriptional regulator